MNKNIVYSLVDPRTNEPRYVGLSTRGLARPQAHAHRSRNGSTHRDNWIKQLQRLGLKYDIQILYESSTDEGLEEQEIYWIVEMKRRGHCLTNHTTGGEVNKIIDEVTRLKLSEAHKGKILSEEHKAIRESCKGKGLGIPLSEEHKQKLSEAHKGHIPSNLEQLHEMHRGRKRSPETCANISAALTGKKRGPQSPEHIEKRIAPLRGRKTGPKSEKTKSKISESLTGRKMDDEIKSKISASLKGKKHTDEHNAKVAAALKGKPLSKEHRAKLSAAKKGS